MPRAAIDIGSNSLLLLVTDDAGNVLHDEANVVGLGRGLGEVGVFRTDRMEAAIAVLGDYAAKARALGVAPEGVRTIATSASRRALNATTFYASVRAKTGLRAEVVSGEEEARLTWLGGVAGLGLGPGPALLCDPGGGSTEVIVGEGPHIRSRVSLEIGTVRLTEQYLGTGVVAAAALARLRAHVDAAVATLQFDLIPKAAVAVAGTATTLAAADLGLERYDATVVHGSTLTAAALRRWIDRLLAATPDERRRLVTVSPERADTVLAGAVILLAVLERTRRQAWRVSDRGLRFGAIQR
ncbi:MAG: Ppx/GppA family phosphatase [Pseudomonadota bacterium]|nr:Ppx/GppA family phosphatase [Pseudomonadota bacterium]